MSYWEGALPPFESYLLAMIFSLSSCLLCYQLLGGKPPQILQCYSVLGGKHLKLFEFLFMQQNSSQNCHILTYLEGNFSNCYPFPFRSRKSSQMVTFYDLLGGKPPISSYSIIYLVENLPTFNLCGENPSKQSHFIIYWEGNLQYPPISSFTWWETSQIVTCFNLFGENPF